jgi:hypothetical protein
MSCCFEPQFDRYNWANHYRFGVDPDSRIKAITQICRHLYMGFSGKDLAKHEFECKYIRFYNRFGAAMYDFMKEFKVLKFIQMKIDDGTFKNNPYLMASSDFWSMVDQAKSQRRRVDINDLYTAFSDQYMAEVPNEKILKREEKPRLVTISDMVKGNDVQLPDILHEIDNSGRLKWNRLCRISKQCPICNGNRIYQGYSWQKNKPPPSDLLPCPHCSKSFGYSQMVTHVEAHEDHTPRV